MHRTALLPGALLLLACNAAPVPDADTGAVSRSPTTAETPAVTAPASDSVSIELELPADVAHGQSIPIVVRARNTTDRQLDVYLRGREPTVDIRVRDAASRVVWERLRDEIIPAIVQLRTLAPGEALEVRLDWDQRTNDEEPVAPGTYTIRASLLTETEPLWSETAEITIREE